jgi:deaminated glutathione amidase
MKIAVHQMCSGIDPAKNAAAIERQIGAAAAAGAQFYFAPEMSGLLDSNRKRAAASITAEGENLSLLAAKRAAKQNAIWVHLGSIPVLSEAEEGKFANRSIVIDPNGTIKARYDKMHLFDVDLESGESWRESSAYVPGQAAALVETPIGQMGLSICYDVRFPELYARLSRAGARVIAVPAAFTVPTGKAHWHILLRARAIENAAFVVAAAQSGGHEDGRETYGHSLVIDPWGEVLLDMGGGEGEGLGYAELDLGRIDSVRRQIPVLANRRDIPKMVNQF